MRLRLTKYLCLIFAALSTFTACRKENAPLPDNLIQFESANQGIGATQNSITIKLLLSRATDKDIPVTINLISNDVVYGTDYTTAPVAASNIIPLTILSGNTEASFTLTKVAGAVFDGTEKLVFTIASSASPIIIGTAKEFTLTFGEIISTGSSILVQGGGATYGNKVFLDLSANSQTAALRTSWDLGFYGGDDWRVILNSSTAMMAKQINKSDLTQVTAADTLGFSSDVIFNQQEPQPSSLAYIDYPNGDLNRTAIATIAANAADNKVYIVNRGTGVGTPAPARGWKKVRIIRNNSGGYTVQHADIASTTFTSVDIPKTSTHFFKYVSFETGAVNVEPAKQKWDLAWTYFTNTTTFNGAEVPYNYQDVILQNRNTSIAKVLVATKSYSAFSEADLTGLTFQTSQVAIGADWRSGGGPSSGPAVYADRYYIIKDGDNNYYKLKFTGMTDNGVRGFPAFEYVLIKKG